MPDRPSSTPAGGRVTRTRRSRLGWLLVIPLLLVLYPPLYNRIEPEILGIPFFYAYQLLAIPVSVACTIVVYRATTTRSKAGAA